MTTSEIAVTMSSPNFDFSQNLDYSIEEDISGWTGKDWTNFIQENLDAFYSENFSPKMIFTIKETIGRRKRDTDDARNRS